ncbi:MAG: hypothetical protein NVSMB2_02040 [Chloroflexota bacterium]
MLVLTRKPEQSLLLGDDVVITVLAIDGDRVKIGIDAPRSLSILRQEVHEQIRAANAAAASSTRPSAHTIAEALRAGQSTPATPRR